MLNWISYLHINHIEFEKIKACIQTGIGIGIFITFQIPPNNINAAVHVSWNSLKLLKHKEWDCFSSLKHNYS